jgi:hypothetical protein
MQAERTTVIKKQTHSETTAGLDRLSCSQHPSSGRQSAHSEQAGDAALASSAWLI